MENVIYTYFRKRKLRRLLVKIMRAHPEMAPALVDLSEEDALTKYMYTAMNEYIVQKLTYQQACEAQPERASFSQQPEMPWLLTQAAMASASPITGVSKGRMGQGFTKCCTSNIAFNTVID